MMNLEEVQAFLTKEFPQMELIIDEVGPKTAKVRKSIGFDQLRPGGTVAGPVLVGVADAGLYVAILCEIGPVALAVTTNLNINFLRRPSGDTDVIGDCRLMKVGKRLVVGEVTLYSDGEAEPIAHVTGTYSIPPWVRNEN